MSKLFVVAAIWPGRTWLSCLWLKQYGQADMAELFVVEAIWPGRHGKVVCG